MTILLADTVACPFYEEPIGRELCQLQSSKLRKNEQTCCARGCPSPYRLCVYCVRQGYNGRDAVVLDPIAGCCIFHQTSGPQADRRTPAQLSGKNGHLKTETVPLVVNDYERVITVPAGRVRPFADQPRSFFNPSEMRQLEKSLLKAGQLQPGIVRELHGDPAHEYELVDGQRRWHACANLGVPFRATLARPRDVEDQFEMSLVANFQRSEHTPMEIAHAVDRLCRAGRRSESDVAELIGRASSWVNQYRRLVKLVPELQAELSPALDEKKRLPVQVACQLAFLTPENQREEFRIIRERQLSSLQAVQRIRQRMESRNGGSDRDWRREPRNQAGALMTFVRAARLKAEFLTERLNTTERDRIFTARPADEIKRLKKEVRAAAIAMAALAATVLGEPV